MALIGMISMGAWAAQDFHFTVEHFSVDGDNPLSVEETRAILVSHEHKSHDLDTLRMVAKDLENAIRAKGHAFYRVVLPSQTIGKGSDVQIKVISFKLGEVQTDGNKHFDRDNILASVPHLQVNEVPDNEAISNDIKVANYHPNKKLALTFRQMENSDLIGANLKAKDQDPQSITATVNTRGSRDTGGFRTGMGYQYSNLFGLDHVIGANFMTSPDHVDGVKQYGLNYMLPIYKTRGWVSGYWAKSDVDSGAIGDFNISGSGEMGGVHYLQFLPRLKNYEHWLDVGWDDKLFNNSVVFGLAQLGTNVRSSPFSLGYRSTINSAGYQAGFNAQWNKNIVSGSFSDSAAYQGNRLGAKPDWDVWRYGGNLDFSLVDGWIWRHAYSGQYSQAPLIAAEQMGLGGLTTVRGYTERETGGDIANLYKTEVWTPQWLPGVNFLAFYDQSHRHLLDTPQSQKPTLWLRGVGLGARWQWQDSASVTLDLAHAIDDGPQTSSGSGRVHAQVMFRF